MNPNPDTEHRPDGSVAARPPRLALLIATGFGLGYLPKAPGSWGSLAGVALAACLPYMGLFLAWIVGVLGVTPDGYGIFIVLALATYGGVTIGVALAGVWAASRAARHFGAKDPQCVVIDEVSGQQIALIGAGLLYDGWKYLLLGFILFRVFDIWKPFPARQAESLPGGWGIMADDWVAGLYAALALWAAQALGF